MTEIVQHRTASQASGRRNEFRWPARRPFLTAEWRRLAMLNYEVEPEILRPFVPAGTELDCHDDKCYVSVVGFIFLRTRLWGLPIPGHSSFEEVNLRFYVRRLASEGRRRGVVFLRELVPRRAVAYVARKVYGENYLAVPMSHSIVDDGGGDASNAACRVEYAWTYARRRHRVMIETKGPAQPLVPGSHEEFIAEHYWGYTALPGNRTAEYQVAHPSWRIRAAGAAVLDADVAALYGPRFEPSLARPPVSAFLAEGSPVRVYRGMRIA